jgi:uncharacterized membrane protein HdeD (DUF308 family)
MIAIATRNWWMLALRGVAAIIFGLIAWIWPGLTLSVLVLLFAAYVFIDGVVALVAAVRGAVGPGRWLPQLIEGIVGVGAGIVAVVWPGLTALALLYVIAVWAMVTGVIEILAAIELRREIDNELLLGLAGLASVVFGILLIIFPGTGALTVTWLIGSYAILFGALLVGLALRLRSLDGRPTR